MVHVYAQNRRQMRYNSSSVVGGTSMRTAHPPSAEADVEPLVAPALRQKRTLHLPIMLRALRHRNYRLFFIGQLISLIGTWMQQVAQGWLVLRLTDSPLQLGL